MPIFPFEAPVFPGRFQSPFLTGGRGTGGLGESLETVEDDKHEVGGIGKQRPRRAATITTSVSQTTSAGASKAVSVVSPTPATAMSLFSVPSSATTSTATGSTPVYRYQRPGPLTARLLRTQGGKADEDQSTPSTVGESSSAESQNGILEKLPPETGECRIVPVHE